VLNDITTRKLYQEQINVSGTEFKSERVISNTIVTIVSKIKQEGEPIKVIRCD
jgi:hypothetical protein